MAEETIVAVFDTSAEADAAVRDLEAAGVPSTSITRHANDSSVATSSSTTGVTQEKGFWASLFGGEPEHDTSVYDRSIQSGGIVVSVRAPDGHATRVTEVLERHNPVDLEERASTYGLTTGTATGATLTGSAMATGAAATRATAATDGERLALSEEQLAVGKRAVNRGTTRIHRFVVETPVEESISLHNESVSIERHAVEGGGPVTGADFTDKVIEVTEMGEEAVVSKTARVREEVVINKTATDRTETVRDTVRREDVEIQKGVADTTTTSTGTTTGVTGTTGATTINRPV